MRSREDYEETWRAIQELSFEWDKWFKSDECSCIGKCSQCIYFGVCKIRMKLDSMVELERDYVITEYEGWTNFLEDLGRETDRLATGMTLQEKREMLQDIENQEKKYDEWVEWYFTNECGECDVCQFKDVCELPNYDKQDREIDK
jgi:hypothetical protein